VIEASVLWFEPLAAVICVFEQVKSLCSERDDRHATGEFRTVRISE
jgi:hypothetical protein